VCPPKSSRPAVSWQPVKAERDVGDLAPCDARAGAALDLGHGHKRASLLPLSAAERIILRSNEDAVAARIHDRKMGEAVIEVAVKRVDLTEREMWTVTPWSTIGFFGVTVTFAAADAEAGKAGSAGAIAITTIAGRYMTILQSVAGAPRREPPNDGCGSNYEKHRGDRGGVDHRERVRARLIMDVHLRYSHRGTRRTRGLEISNGRGLGRLKA
jgi:hypothetical protein